MARIDPQPRPMPTRVFAALLTLLLGIQPVSTDLYLPALPTLRRDLGASIEGAQLTLSVLIVCFGLGQLLCGPLSDRFGRRPVLLAGLAAYTIASFGAAASTGIATLIVWRAVQGAAMAASVTCGRSIVRDLYDPAAGARMMSSALTGLGCIAVLSPLIGGALVEAFGWHAAMLAPAIFGAFTLAMIAWRLEETVPTLDATATRPANIVRNWRRVCANPTFRAWALLSACTYGGLFCMLAGSSFVFIGMLGVERATFGIILASMSLAYIAGTFLCRRLLLRHGLRGAVARGACLSLAGGGSMALLSLAGVHEVWAILLPQYVYALGHGVHQPCGQAGAVGPFPEKAGVAASLSGFAMTVTALGVGLWLGHALDVTVYPLTLGFGAFSVAVTVVAWTLVRRHGEPAIAARARVAVRPA
ncbi:MAG TPA: multidrug effflux MFS transporter [Caldimonas sp.]|nr:multidrug effflux MFS transporter [Caldimonas sp.]